ncbi:phage tail protein [Cronobacter sakazakii]|nr:phage tail protein [Cronobacter sakazakii]HEO1584232.1 phage tail protein [Cronobacter sakazakii]HEO1588382.1 phage tail protein [Cronobacter sakazakii]
MATKYYAVLTNVGAAKLANATALGAQVEITHMAVGDGNGVLPTPNQAQTALVHELRRAPLNSLSIDPNNANQIIAEQVIPEDVGGWWIREIGLFDKDGDMIAVANCAETYKPQLQEGSGRVQIVRMILIVSNTAAVTLKIDPSVVLATRAYVDSQIIIAKSYADDLMDTHLANANPHDQYPLIANALKEMADAGLVDEVLKNLGLGDASGYVGRLLKIQVFTASGTVTKTPGAKKWRIKCLGAGGGSSAAPATGSNEVSVSNGGGSGAYAEGIYDVSSITTASVVIGSGGAGGTADSIYGADGGASSVGSFISSPGGRAGLPAGPANPPFQPVANSNSDSSTGWNIVGSSGSGAEPAVAVANSYAVGSRGSNSIFGVGGSVPALNSPANPGGGYGSGASGCSNGPSQSAKSGAAGRHGIVIIEELA